MQRKNLEPTEAANVLMTVARFANISGRSFFDAIQLLSRYSDAAIRLKFRTVDETELLQELLASEYKQFTTNKNYKRLRTEIPTDPYILQETTPAEILN